MFNWFTVGGCALMNNQSGFGFVAINSENNYKVSHFSAEFQLGGRPWGKWGKAKTCSENHHAVGITLKIERRQVKTKICKKRKNIPQRMPCVSQIKLSVLVHQNCK